MAFMGYYGQTQNMANLSPDNIFVSYFLAALVEIPCWAVPFAISKLGCRWPLLAFFLVSGFCGVVYGIVPADNQTLQLSVGLMGKMTVTGAYYICQQYSSEVFPTVVRGQGVSQISTGRTCLTFFCSWHSARWQGELPFSSPRWLSTLPSFPQSSPSLSLASALSLALSPPSSYLRQLDESYLILSGAGNTRNSQHDVELSETGRILERSRVGWSSPG